MYQSRILAHDAAPLFGSKPPPPLSWRERMRELDVVVDLGAGLFSRRWWRGLATLVALLGLVAWLAPRFEPLPGDRAEWFDAPQAEQWDALGIGGLAAGSPTGLPMAETGAVTPLSEAPVRTEVALVGAIGPGNDGLTGLLVRSGTVAADAARAAALVRGTGRPLAPGTMVSFTLGAPLAGGARPLQRLELQAGMDLRVRLARAGEALALSTTGIAVDRRPLRIRGKVGDGLYWSLRAAGASPMAAAQYLQAIATQVEVGSAVATDDRFTLVLANARAATGETVTGPLLYAGLERTLGAPLQLVKWNGQWVDAASSGSAAPRTSSGIFWPVQARITSTFGMRYHPILHYARMHKGVDFGAHYGQPIQAAAEGQVIQAGWAGGYGQQVRIAHGNGLVTSYSHMSRMAVTPGTLVHQGQVIGFVGSTGLSTGPHLHFETLQGGVAVNPLGVRFTSVAPVNPGASAAIKARVKELLGG
ncbi:MULTISPECIES: M23 family metallopeptidase [Sphingomonas]|uniref:M23 family metallopeptidase n=1 Tax=Sphingomonas TaxID=13687 RepID=UPI000DEED219|nr:MULTISPECIES: M23 family metallopeptidase [Sphingomonas]